MLQPLAVRGACVIAMAASVLAQAPRVELTGFATLQPDTFAAGPPSGRFRNAGIRGDGFPSQPVQGFSSIRPDPRRPGWWLVLCDNGYGIRANSPDFLLRIYAVRPRWRTSQGGEAQVDVGSWIQLSDPSRLVPFRLAREDTAERWLTGADFDPESFVSAPDGTLWIGDEFGPFLLHVDRQGRLVAPPSDVDGLRSPDHPGVPVPDAGGTSAATVRRSRGFEGLAIANDGTVLFAMLETAPVGGPADTTRILEFDISANRFTGRAWAYRFDAPGLNATEFVSYAPGRFLTIERDNAAGREARVKRVFAVHLGEPGTEVEKTLVSDLLEIADPGNVAGHGPAFIFPFITTEAIWPEDDRTIVLVNDNNYPGGGGRPAGGPKDASEFIRLRLPQSLPR